MDTQDLPLNRKRSIPVARILDRMTDDLDIEVIAGYQGLRRPRSTRNRGGIVATAAPNRMR